MHGMRTDLLDVGQRVRIGRPVHPGGGDGAGAGGDEAEGVKIK